MKYILSLILCIFTQYCFAQVSSSHQTTLLVGENLFLLLAPGHDDQIRVYRKLNGVISQLKLVDRSNLYFGKDRSLDITFESGERLVVKDFGTMLESTYMTPTQAPQRLKSEKVNGASLEQLGFRSDFVWDSLEKKGSKSSYVDNYLKTAAPKIFIELRPVRIAEFSSEFRLARIQSIKKIGASEVQFLEPLTISSVRYPIIIMASYSSNTEDRIREILGDSSQIHIFDFEQVDKKHSDFFDNYLKEFVQSKTFLKTRIELLSGLYFYRRHLVGLDHSKKEQLVAATKKFIIELSQLHDHLFEISKRELYSLITELDPAESNTDINSISFYKKLEIHPGYQKWLVPLRRAGNEAFEILREVHLESAEDFILERPDLLSGAGFSTLVQHRTLDDRSFFMKWLDQRESESTNINYSRMKPQYSVGLLNTSSMIQETTVITRADRTWTIHPAFVFGLSGDMSKEIAAVVNYVLRADKDAQKFSDWYTSTFDRSHVRASNGDLIRLIIELAEPSFVTQTSVNNFLLNNYLMNVMEIYLQLLETSRLSITNPSVYRALLLGIKKITLLAEKQISLQGVSVSPPLINVAYKLQSLLSKKLLESIQDVHMTAPRVCLDLLHPDPWLSRLRNLSQKN